MKSLEDVFVGEFKKRVGGIGHHKDIYSIPLPKECSSWSISGADLFTIKGISEVDSPYSKLNSCVVKGVPYGYTTKRRVIDKAVRGFKRSEDGGYVYEDYAVPSGSIVVISNVNINVPYKGKGYKNATESGFGYIDFVDTKYGREYLYVVPKSVVYGVHQTALALSVTNMKNYSGSGYVTWGNGVIFLHVIPYNPRSKYVGSRVLATKCSLNYSNEVNAILTYWQKVGVIPNLRLCLLGDGSNLALKRTSVGYEGYVQVEPLALSDIQVYGSIGENLDGDNGKVG